MKKTALILALFIALCCLPCFSACNETKRTNYQISLNFDGERTVNGEQTVEFFNDTEDVVDELWFNLFANAYRQNATYKPISEVHKITAYYEGESYGNIEISSVKVDGAPADYQITGKDQTILSVALGKEIFPYEKVKIDIVFSVSLAHVISRTGINQSTINLANVYPILCVFDNGTFYECNYYSTGDPFYSECADYKVSVSAPERFTIVGAGNKGEEVVEDGVKRANFSLENARSFAIVVSDKFKTLSDTVDGITLNYHYYFDDNASEHIEYAKKSLIKFGELFGKYPYQTYNVVQTGFLEGGMEYPTLVMISDALDVRAIGEVIVHETAHQWWQSVVGNNEIEYAFLDEGLAEYSVLLFYETHPEYGLTREDLVKNAESTYKLYCTVYEKLFGRADTRMLRNLGEYNGEYEYVNTAYVKPCIMYDCLRTTIGDDDFFGALKKYYRDYAYKNATPDDLVGAFVKTGADVEGFFKSFFDGKAIL